MKNRYVVKVTQYIARGTPETHWVYLAAVSESPKPCPTKDDFFRATTEEQTEAFKFRSRIAAETIAAHVGGKVVKLARTPK